VVETFTTALIVAPAETDMLEDPSTVTEVIILAAQVLPLKNKYIPKINSTFFIKVRLVVLYKLLDLIITHKQYSRFNHN